MTLAWPPLDPEVEQAVLRQLHETVSIYDRSGIIERFENAFAARHRAAHPLLTSSGTAALLSAYYGLGIGVGDEVLVQDYTFFATAMPLFILGANPVLTDVHPDGSLDLEHAASLLTSRTRALVVTHMWGHPQDMAALRAFCDRNALALVEDCSHAHGASRDGISVGQLADAAAWSLQGKKTITAGEGGIMTARDRATLDRATLLGHFAKRAVAEVDPAHPLYRYAATGLGLKLRSHPLGLAMAEVYLDRLDDWLAARARHADQLAATVAQVPGVRTLTSTAPACTPTLYAWVAVVDPDQAGFTRDQLLERLHARPGGRAFNDCSSMPPLHTLPAFTEPISPVTVYDASCARSALAGSATLAARTFRIDLPANDGPDAVAYTRASRLALNSALGELSAATVGP